MKITCSLGLILLTIWMLPAQNYFDPGYFITNSGDTTQCRILNEQWLNSPTRVRYQLDAEGAVQYFEVQEVREFATESGLRYRRVTGDFPTTERFTLQKSPSPAPRTENLTVFVKALVEGPASLYMFKGRNDEVYLLEHPVRVGGPEILLYKEYIEVGSNDIRQNNLFRRQLYRWVKCPGVSSIQEVAYSRASLMDYIENYNNCGQTPKEGTRAQTGGRPDSVRVDAFRFGVNTGLIRYSYATSQRSIFDPDGFGPTPPESYRGELVYEPKWVLTFGLGMEKTLGFNNGKWSVLLDIQWAAYQSSAVYSGTRNNEPVEIQEASEINLNQLSLIPALRRRFFLGPASGIYAQAGVVTELNFGEITFRPELDSALRDLEKFSVGAVGTLGYFFSRQTSIGVSYIYSGGISQTQSEPGQLRRLLVSFTLKI